MKNFVLQKLKIAIYIALGLCGTTAWSKSPEFLRDSVLYKMPEIGVHYLDLRVNSDSKHWCLLWNYVDSLNFDGLEVKDGNDLVDYDVYGKYTAEVYLVKYTNGIGTVLARNKVAHKYNNIGLRIRMKDGKTGVLYGGDGEEIRFFKDKTQRVENDPLQGSKFVFRSIKPGKYLEYETIAWKKLNSGCSRFETEEQLRQYLKTTKDTLEGMWEYLDREITTETTTLGGFYKLATVREANGTGYEIVYLAEGQKYASFWETLDLKGRFTPTIFVNNFDLEWTDAERKNHFTKDCWLNVLEHNTILELHFPLNKAIIRFRRVMNF